MNGPGKMRKLSHWIKAVSESHHNLDDSIFPQQGSERDSFHEILVMPVTWIATEKDIISLNLYIPRSCAMCMIWFQSNSVKLFAKASSEHVFLY